MADKQEGSLTLMTGLLNADRIRTWDSQEAVPEDSSKAIEYSVLLNQILNAVPAYKKTFALAFHTDSAVLDGQYIMYNGVARSSPTSASNICPLPSGSNWLVESIFIDVWGNSTSSGLLQTSINEYDFSGNTETGETRSYNRSWSTIAAGVSGIEDASADPLVIAGGDAVNVKLNFISGLVATISRAKVTLFITEQ